MRGFWKRPSAAVIALLLALGLAACGGGSDAESTATRTAPQEESAGQGGSAQHEDGKNGNSSSAGTAESASGGEAKAGGSGNFTPKPHNDSGGGSAQFRVKGGDNSIQEFGEETTGSEFDEVATVVHGYLDARAAADWAAACSYVSKRVAEGLEQLGARAKGLKSSSCAVVMGKLTNPAAMGELRTEAEKADIGSVRVEGDQAFVIYRGLGGTVYAFPLTREGDAWKVGGLTGTALS